MLLVYSYFSRQSLKYLQWIFQKTKCRLKVFSIHTQPGSSLWVPHSMLIWKIYVTFNLFLLNCIILWLNQHKKILTGEGQEWGSQTGRKTCVLTTLQQGTNITKVTWHLFTQSLTFSLNLSAFFALFILPLLRGACNFCWAPSADFNLLSANLLSVCIEW